MSTTGLRRLNRRRYRESVNVLKEIIADKKAPALRKLRAIDTLLGIYDRHDRTEQQKEARRELAAERAAQASAFAQTGSAIPDPEETTEEFLARLKRQEARLNEHEQEQETEEDDDE